MARSIARRLTTLIGIGLALGALAEIAARAVLPYNPPLSTRLAFNLQYRRSGVVSFYLVPNQIIYQGDAGRVNHDKVKYRINQYGFRGDVFPQEKGDGEIRVAILGGSHVFDTYSYDYEGNPGFTRLIQDGYRAEGVHLTVINAGVPGADTRYLPQRVLLHLRRFSPDVVIVNSTWNDLKWISRTTVSTDFQAAPPMASANPLIEPLGPLDRWLGISALYRHSRDTYWRLALDLDGRDVEGRAAPAAHAVDLDEGLQQYRANVAGTVFAIRSIGAVPILAVEERLVASGNSEEVRRRIGYHYVNVDDHSALVDLYLACDSILNAVSRALDFELLDANRELGGASEYFFDHVHTTPAGSRRIAEHYVQALRPTVEALTGGRR